MCWYKAASWNQFCRKEQQRPNSTHFIGTIWNLRTGTLAGLYHIRSLTCQILAGLYYLWPLELEKSTWTFCSDFLIQQIIPVLSTLQNGSEGALWTKKDFMNIKASWTRHFSKKSCKYRNILGIFYFSWSVTDVFLNLLNLHSLTFKITVQ